MKPNSLALRLFLTAAAWVLLVLPVAGWIIYARYRPEVELQLHRIMLRSEAAFSCWPSVGNISASSPEKRLLVLGANENLGFVSASSCTGVRGGRNAPCERARRERYDVGTAGICT